MNGKRTKSARRMHEHENHDKLWHQKHFLHFHKGLRKRHDMTRHETKRDETIRHGTTRARHAHDTRTTRARHDTTGHDRHAHTHTRQQTRKGTNRNYEMYNPKLLENKRKTNPKNIKKTPKNDPKSTGFRPQIRRISIPKASPGGALKRDLFLTCFLTPLSMGFGAKREPKTEPKSIKKNDVFEELFRDRCFRFLSEKCSLLMHF